MPTGPRTTRLPPTRGGRRFVPRRRRRGRTVTAWAHLLDLDDPSGCDARRATASSSPSETPPSIAGRGSALAFVELSPLVPAGPTECTIELAEPGGKTLRISLHGAPGPELVALAQALWRAAR